MMSTPRLGWQKFELAAVPLLDREDRPLAIAVQRPFHSVSYTRD
jgi:hypothetical protein